MSKLMIYFVFVLLAASVAFAQCIPGDEICVAGEGGDLFCDDVCGEGWYCGGENKTNYCYPPFGEESEVPELTTLGIGAAIVAGGAAFTLIRKKK